MKLRDGESPLREVNLASEMPSFDDVNGRGPHLL